MTMEARKPRRKLMAEINVVPFVDIVLVLMVVFMVTSPVVTQGIKVDLPKANAEIIEDSEEETLVVSIDAQGNYFISLGIFSEENSEPVSLNKIIEDVSKIMNANPAVPVFLEADPAIEYGLVANLMSAVKDAGAPTVSLIFQPPE